jgi:hypothetical protein
MVLPVLLLVCAQAAEPRPSPAVPPPPPATTPAAAEPPGPLTGQLHLQPRGVFVVNTAYNHGTLYPGSFVLLALPPAISQPQFFISPQNTVLGFKLTGLSLNEAQISGALDVNLRSSTPLLSVNTIAPQFYDVHIQLETTWFRAFVGQFPDVVLPFVPDSVNSFPVGAVPGALGYARPQLRGEVRVPMGALAQVNLQGSLNRPIQTFELNDQLVGRQAGRPDQQGRVALAFGRSERAWERPYEVGLAAHNGRRRVTVVQDASASDTVLRTWSVAGDLRARLPTSTLIKARLWTGSLLGDYGAGVFQTVNPTTRRAIRANGLWAGVTQGIARRWRAGVIYGRDNPRDGDVQPGKPRLNHAAFVNLFWDVSRTVGFGAEASRWATDYGDAGVARAWRADTLFYLRF